MSNFNSGWPIDEWDKETREKVPTDKVTSRVGMTVGEKRAKMTHQLNLEYGTQNEACFGKAGEPLFPGS